jgi:hypothetical protein
MRRLGSEKEIERKKKRNTLIISIIMLGILVAGTAAYGFISSPTQPDPTTNLPEEGELQYLGNRWVVTHLGRQFSFVNSPESETVQEIPVDITISLQDYLSKSIYIDAENPSVLQEVGSALQGYASRIQEGCHESCPERDVPEKTCDDYLIVWTDATEKKVYQEQNCVFIEGDMEAVDAFLFEMIGI